MSSEELESPRELLSDYVTNGLDFKPPELLKLRQLGTKVRAISHAIAFNVRDESTYPSAGELERLMLEQELSNPKELPIDSTEAELLLHESKLAAFRSEQIRCNGQPEKLYTYKIDKNGEPRDLTTRVAAGWLFYPLGGPRPLVCEAVQLCGPGVIVRALMSFSDNFSKIEDPREIPHLERETKRATAKIDQLGEYIRAVDQTTEIAKANDAQAPEGLVAKLDELRQVLQRDKDHTSTATRQTIESIKHRESFSEHNFLLSVTASLRRETWQNAELMLRAAKWNDRKMAKLVTSGSDVSQWAFKLNSRVKDEDEGKIIELIKSDRKKRKA